MNYSLRSTFSLLMLKAFSCHLTRALATLSNSGNKIQLYALGSGIYDNIPAAK